MASSDLPANLRLLCSYTRSISDAARRMGINRQQLHRYLSGQAQPSLSRLRLISDYFGLEESELLLEHEELRNLLAIRRPVVGDLSALSQRVQDVLLLTPESLERGREYAGFYLNYFCPPEYPGRILVSFLQVYEDNGFLLTRNIERYPEESQRRSNRYNGVLVHSGERIMMYEREARVGKKVWLTVLYPHDRDQPALLPGLALGITGNAPREIACYRVIQQYLGRSINVRSTLARCGAFPTDDPRIETTIRERVRNDMKPGDTAFGIRL